MSVKNLGYFLICGALVLQSEVVFSRSAEEFWNCVDEVERVSGVDKNVIVAIKIIESGSTLKPPVTHNSNGTVDVGIMQTNSIWFPELRTHGINWEMLKDNCVSLKIAAWMLVKHFRKTHDMWEAVGIYHSKTPRLKVAYRQKVREVYDYLRERNK